MSTYFIAETIRRGAPLYQIIIILISDLLSMIGLSGVFKKAGRKPFLAFIPGINDYILYSLSWDNMIGIIVVIFKVLMIIFFPYNGRILASGIQGHFCFYALIVLLLLAFIMKWKLALSFSRSVIFAFFLMFLPQVFYPILGFDRSKYLGETLRRYNTKEKKEKREDEISGNHMMIALYKKRSITALVSAIIVCVCTFYAVATGLLETSFYQRSDASYSMFKYFTTNSNTLSAVGAAFLIPYAVEGIRVKRFSFPKWVGMIQYSGAICTTLTMIFAFLIIFPTQGKQMALGGTNFWLHLICPVMALVLFLSVESDFGFTFYDCIVCLVPFFIYAAIYTISVVLIGREYGGWQDIYHLADQLPASISAPVMCAFALGVALLIRHLYNRLSQFRRKKMMSSWSRDAKPEDIENEAFDLGKHYGLYDDRNDMTIPVDIIEELSKTYDIRPGLLYRAYVRGMNEGLKEREDRVIIHPGMLTAMFGTPRDLYSDKKEEQ